MALFGIFGKKSESDLLAKYAERAANKRAQAVDRWDAIHALGRMATSEAVEALLPRFTFYTDPTITDQEEKDAAFEAIVAAGDAAVAPVKRFLTHAESLSWPVKMLDRLVSPDAVIGTLTEVLGAMDIEYERDPQRKIQLLGTLEERTDIRIAAAVVRFLDDANETVRFVAVGSLLAQADAENYRDAMLDTFAREDSVRVRNRILDGFIAAKWSLGDRADAVKTKFPSGYSLGPAGVPQKR